jgi:CheY-like chemotaxis protein
MMRRALLVEDDEEQAARLMHRLREDGVSCALIESPEGVMERCSRESFDVLIMDMGFDDKTTEEVIELIEEVGLPCVVYTGMHDKDLVKMVRHVGAAYVQKPGLDLLLEKVWAQINRRAPDDESAVRQQEAQIRLRAARPLFASRGAIVGTLIGLMTATGGFGSWAFKTLTDKVTQSEETKHRIDVVSAKTTSLEDATKELQSAVREIRQQNQISIDERASLKEGARELKVDIKERLDRIERKLDARSISYPIPPVAKAP